jgi:hypothetical protein
VTPRFCWKKVDSGWENCSAYVASVRSHLKRIPSGSFIVVRIISRGLKKKKLKKLKLTMGKFDGKQITGVVGNLVFKRGRDKKDTIIQIKPARVKQTKASKVTAGIFAKASSLAKLLRQDFNPIMSGFYDGAMVNRFNTLNRSILDHCYDKETKTYVFEEDSFSRLAGFEFDAKSLLGNYFWADPVVHWEDSSLRITIPAFETNKQLKFPGRANTCKMKITVGLYNFSLSQHRNSYYEEINVAQNQGLVPEQEFTFEVPEGCFCVAGIGLEYFYQYNDVRNSLNNKELSPARLLSAIITPGTFVLPPSLSTPYKSVAPKWQEHSALNFNVVELEEGEESDS